MNSGRKRLFLTILLSGITLVSVPQTRSLGYYIGEGLKNSPLLNDLQNQLNAATIDSLVTLARRKPQVDWKSQLLYSPYNEHLGYDEVITDGGNYQAAGSVSQNIFNRKRINNELNTISNQKEGIFLSTKLSVAELKKAITNLYLDAWSAYSDLLFNESFLTLMNDQNKIIEQFVKTGIYNQSDYLSMVVETQGQEIVINQLRNQYLRDTRLLNEACGIVDTAHVVLSEPEITLSSSGFPSDYLFLKQYSVDSVRIINEKNALNLKYKPTVTWFADAGILTSNPWNFYRHFGASAGVSLNFPIYDGNQRKLEEKKLIISENTRSYYRINARKQYDQEYLRLKEELDGIKEIKTRLEKQLLSADQLVKSLRAQLETGIVRMTDYLNALKNYRSISHSLNMSDIGMLVIINEMNYVLAE